jgi:hypothetical protein
MGMACARWGQCKSNLLKSEGRAQLISSAGILVPMARISANDNDNGHYNGLLRPCVAEAVHINPAPPGPGRRQAGRQGGLKGKIGRWEDAPRRSALPLSCLGAMLRTFLCLGGWVRDEDAEFISLTCPAQSRSQRSVVSRY